MKEEKEELGKEDVVVVWEPMGLRRRRLAMILTEKEKEKKRIEFEIQRKKERKSERERERGEQRENFKGVCSSTGAGCISSRTNSLPLGVSCWSIKSMAASASRLLLSWLPSRHHPYRSLCLPPFLFDRLFASIGCCARKHSASLSNGTIVAIRIRCYCRRMRRISVHDRQWSD